MDRCTDNSRLGEEYVPDHGKSVGERTQETARDQHLTHPGSPAVLLCLDAGCRRFRHLLPFFSGLPRRFRKLSQPAGVSISGQERPGKARQEGLSHLWSYPSPVPGFSNLKLPLVSRAYGDIEVAEITEQF